MSSTSRTGRGIWLKLGVCGLVLPFIVELGTRLLDYGPARPNSIAPGLFVEHDERGFSLRPDFVSEQLAAKGPVPIQIDAQGRRKRGRALDVSSTTILAIGDGQTFGLGVAEHDAWPAILESHLLSKGQSVQVVNAGAPGYNAEQVASWLPELLDNVRPQSVLWTVYLGNDISGIWADEQLPPLVRSGMLVHEDGRPLLGVRTWLHCHSRAWRGLVEPRIATTTHDEDSLRSSILSSLDWDPGFALAMARKAEPEGVTVAWQRFEAALDEVQAACAERGVELSLVVLPAPLQIDSSLWREVFSRMRMDPAEVDLEKPSARLNALAQARALTVYDPSEKLRGWAEVTVHLLQKPYAGYQLSIWGHRILGQHLARVVAGG